MTRDEESEIVAKAISTPAGFSVEFDILQVYRLEDGRYAVTDGVKEELFTKVENAADRFIERRHDLGLGFDNEGVEE